MLSGVSMARAPKGTPSSILTLRLRRCFYTSPLDASYPHHPPSLISQDAIAIVQSLLQRFDTNVSHGAKPFDQPHTSNTPFNDGLASAHRGNTGTQPMDPFGGALQAMRTGDTRRLLFRLNVIERMSREELQNAAETIPRTTFTEFFRALDPLRVARDCDQIDMTQTPVGMFKILNMESSIDDWGVRKLYTRLLQRLLILMNALQNAGYTLHSDEYISLFRCAGVSSDIFGAGAIWKHLISGPARTWQNSEMYTEYIKARFLTEPLYTNYQKTTRMVTPRNLHRSRLYISESRKRRLDHLRMRVRLRRHRLGLSKEVSHVEELMRKLRSQGPAVRLFRGVVGTQYLDENIMCALMIALGRSGSLRFIGTEILQSYFGIRTPHPFPAESEAEWARTLNFRSGTPRITPTVRLMRAVVETYGSNAEIGVAVQLVEYLSNTYKISVPPDVWQDLLEWTHIMSTPPASFAWETAELHFKIPSPEAVEKIWDAMTSSPYNLIPTFKNYDLLIRSLISRCSDDLTPVLLHMRKAIALYDEQCRHYEAAVFEYTQHLRDGVASSTVTLDFERARFKKQRMWYDISTWCRMILKRIPSSKESPIPYPLIPGFIQEFRPFLKNPVEYETPTGHVSLVDPAIETFKVIRTGAIVQELPMKNLRGKWTTIHLRNFKMAVLSRRSLAKFKPSKLRDPLNLLAPQVDAFLANPINRATPPFIWESLELTN
ncbi:mitochondrial ATPase expression-domain-containing protein [Xylaria scruposa]|nr:mitochondrial ATPase expression-domain-containing protein [Xylaria scruposa]